MPSKCDSILMYMAWVKDLTSKGRKGGGVIHSRHECDQKMKVVNKINLNLINPINYNPNKMSSSVNKITMCRDQ